jgi:4-hydroxy-tetrahydrodipicolinate synthase
LQNGAAGCISGLGNALPDVLAGILQGYNRGDLTEAERQQAIFTAFRTELYALGFAPAMVKRALYLQDTTVGASRQPALLPDPEQDAKIAEILRRFDIAGSG